MAEMTIKKLYELIPVPPNLARHMFEVAAVGDSLSRCWRGDLFRADLVRKALLVHDIGNLVKFRRPFLGELEKNADFWHLQKKNLINKYGSDAQAATLSLLNEYRVSPEIITVVSELSQLQQQLDLSEISIEAKICEFADLCVSPEGIVGISSRVRDLRLRYKNIAENLESFAKELQNELQAAGGDCIPNILQEIEIVPTELYEAELIATT